jgi:hypothetical protein
MILRAGLFLMGIMVVVAVGAGILFHYTGVLVVDVKNKDHHIYAPVPMLLMRGAVHAFPLHTRIQVPGEVRKHADMIQAMAQALDGCPDGDFVEVETPREKVLVRKEGRNLYVDAVTKREEIHLQIPINATGSLLADLAEK